MSTRVWAGQDLLQSSNGPHNHRFSLCCTSTFIGTNDCHTVLFMNSFGTINNFFQRLAWMTTIKERLGKSHQVAKISCVHQPDYQILHKVYKGTKNIPCHIITKYQQGDQHLLNNHLYKETKATGCRIASLTTDFRRKYQSVRPLSSPQHRV